MENRSQYDDLLTKYLLNELSSSDEQNVLDWINANEEHKVYFEHFKAAWNLSATAYPVNTVDIDQEWEYHKRVIGGGEIITRKQEYCEDTPDDRSHHKGKIFRILIATSIAASLLLFAGLGIHFFKENGRAVVQPMEAKQYPANAIAAVYPQMLTETNSSATPRNLLLQDGSQVVLYSNSELSYDKIFSGRTREIKLKGKADFKVFKDKSKPFIVYSGDISTTALGTEFTVTAFEKAATKSVKLYEGKVVIRSTESAIKKLKSAIYLLPGQELIYNNEKATATVQMFRKMAENRKPANSEELPLPDNYKGSWFMFNNQSLPDVFDQLEAMFNVKIDYTKRDLEKMYFIGKFDKTDSLENILKKMAILYHLKMTRQANTFIISK